MIRVTSAFAALSFVGLVSATIAQIPSTAHGTWRVKAPMPGGGGDVAAVVVGDKLFVFGGSEAPQATRTAAEYDPATDKWRERAPRMAGRNHLGIATVNGKIYTFGGFTRPVHQGANTDAAEYDPATDTWRMLAPMPTLLGSVGAAAVGGKIHVIGGRGVDGNTVGNHTVYDPTTNRWTILIST